MASLRRRILGRTGVEVTELGVGGYIGALTDESASDAQRQDAAIDLGVRYFDTSPAYGTAERYLGAALSTLSVDVRAQLTVSTKVGTHPERRNAYAAGDVRWCYEMSHALLGRIDIVYVHDPVRAGRCLRGLGGIEGSRRHPRFRPGRANPSPPVASHRFRTYRCHPAIVRLPLHPAVIEPDPRCRHRCWCCRGQRLAIPGGSVGWHRSGGSGKDAPTK
jgi:hypothetical protein